MRTNANVQKMMDAELMLVEKRLRSRGNSLYAAAQKLKLSGVKIDDDQVSAATGDCHVAADEFGMMLTQAGYEWNYKTRQWVKPEAK